MDTMTTEDLMYEWYEIVSPYYPKIAEHLELDNTYDIDVHYPDKVKYELNGCSTWNQIAQDNPAMLFTEFYLETIRELSNLENKIFPENKIEMLDGSFISVEEAERRLEATDDWKRVYTDKGELHPISLIALGHKFTINGDTYGE